MRDQQRLKAPIAWSWAEGVPIDEAVNCPQFEEPEQSLRSIADVSPEPGPSDGR